MNNTANHDFSLSNSEMSILKILSTDWSYMYKGIRFIGYCSGLNHCNLVDNFSIFTLEDNYSISFEVDTELNFRLAPVLVVV